MFHPKQDQVNIIKPALSFKEWIRFSLLFSTSISWAPTVEYAHDPLIPPTPFHSCGSHGSCYALSAPPIWALLISPRIDCWWSWANERISLRCLGLEPERKSRYSLFRGWKLLAPCFYPCGNNCQNWEIKTHEIYKRNFLSCPSTQTEKSQAMTCPCRSLSFRYKDTNAYVIKDPKVAF